MTERAGEVYFAEVRSAEPDSRSPLRRLGGLLLGVLHLVLSETYGGGGHSVAIRLRAQPQPDWQELGPATQREARALLKMVETDLATLRREDFELKYRSRHEPLPPWPDLSL